MTKRYVIISDTQIPFDDRKAMERVIEFIGDYQPEEVIHIGDLMDFPAPARWSKGTAEEFAKFQLPDDIADAKKRFLEPLRAVYGGPVGVIEGNHDERPRVYLSKYAPAVSGYDFYNFENLLDFDQFGVKKLPEFYEFAPGWVATHGHRGGIRLTQEAGKTALNAAKRFGKSVVMGHTHRLGLMSHTLGYGGKADQVLTGFEVGNLMNMKLAGYLKGATANWQQGFGLITVLKDGTTVPQAVPITGGAFAVEGNVYRV